MQNPGPFQKYNQFMMNESKKKDFYNFILSDIQINIDVIVRELKDKFKMSSWYVYHNDISLSLKYYSTSDDSDDNIVEIKKFLFEKLPYFKDLQVYKDDKRIVLRFIDVGEPVKFKFFR